MRLKPRAGPELIFKEQQEGQSAWRSRLEGESPGVRGALVPSRALGTLGKTLDVTLKLRSSHWGLLRRGPARCDCSV